MRHAWPDALVAGYYAEGYLERMRAAVVATEKVWAALAADPHFTVERIPSGTSALRMTVEGVAPEQYQTRLAHIGVQLPDAQAGVSRCTSTKPPCRWRRTNSNVHSRARWRRVDPHRASSGSLF